MKKIAISLLAAGAFLILAGVSSAAPVTLDCRASGAAGAVTFRFMFDDATKQASTVWSAGGGRPAASVFGESGSENNFGPVGIDVASIVAPFRHSAVDDPYAYQVNIDRTNGKLRFIRYTPLRISEGSCGKSATPATLF